jgi:hypothetical protein
MMNKFQKFAYVGAIALLSTGFAACTSEDDVADTNPNYNSETKEVNANFVFSVATSTTPSTRMSAANTQADLGQTFRGIDNAELLSYKLGVSNDGQHVATATEANKVFSLGTVMGSGSLTNTAGQPQAQSRRVLELALPTETNALLFYGKAIKDATDDQEGKITWYVNKNIANNSFSLSQRVGTDKQPEFKQVQKLIAKYLTALCEAGISTETTYSFGTETANNITMKWSDYANITASAVTAKETAPADPSRPMSSLGEILADAFVNFNTVYPGEIRAGSAPAVARMLADLYVVVNKMASTTETTPTSLDETIAQAVAQGIKDKIDAVLNNPKTNPEWKDAGHIATAAGTTLADIKTAAGASEALASTFNIGGFPTTLYNVPMGSAELATTLDAANNKVTWNYVEDLPMTAMGGGTTSVFNYMYPAELCYFGNSPIRATNDAHVTNDYPNGVVNWDDDAQWAAGVNNNTVTWTKNGHILSTTRSVAMQENINYGTALLKSTVRYGAGTLKDNNHAIQLARSGADEVDNTISATSDAFLLTGIVIGGQEAEMGWNYIAKAAAPQFKSMIYDKDIPSQAIPAYTAGGAKSDPNYTLVWDNWNQALKGGKQNDVYIALEFTNNTGQDFWGNANIVRKGGTFYIIGKLDPDAGLSTSDRSEGITWPAKYALPPYATDGSTIKERRIFIQDFMTEANFVIGENSLKAAYVTVPDLRSTQISLGLSVDLKWETGLTFENVVLGQ